MVSSVGRVIIYAGFLMALDVRAQVSGAAAVKPPVVHAVYPGGEAMEMGRRIAEILVDPTVARAHWGIAVAGVDGTPVWGMDTGKLFRPASNAKLYTTAAAMALLGREAQVSTQLVMAGHQGMEQTAIVNGVFHGDLELTGDGDANFGSGRTFPYLVHLAEKPQATASAKLQQVDAMAASVAALGVKRIEGDIVVSDSEWPEPIPETWELDDLLWGYGAPVSSMTVNDNEVKLTVTPGIATGLNVRAATDPDPGYYALDLKAAETVAAGEPASLRIERAPGSRTIRISGRIPAGAAYVTELAIAEPAEFAGAALKVFLAAEGVTVDGVVRVRHALPVGELNFAKETREPIPGLPVAVSAPLKIGSACFDNCRVVVDAMSQKLSEDLAVTLKESQNLHAEMMLRRLGVAWGKSGSNAQGARVIRQWLLNAGLDGDDFLFYDGSGLSGKDLVTPRATVKLLSYAATQPWFPQWKAALPVGGVDGSLSGRFKEDGVRGKVFAKTGTLGESRALSGYVVCASGKELAFSIMVDDHSPVGSGDRAAMDKIVAAIAAGN